MFRTMFTLIGLLALVGCTRVEYLEYRGEQAWPTGSAFVQTIDGIEVYEGLPGRAYDIVGLVDVYDDKPFYHDDSTRRKVISMARAHGGDAIIWLSDRTVSSGYLRMGPKRADAAALDTGRSTQPEMIVTNANQNVATSYKKTLRSSLLLAKWRQPPASGG